MNKTIVEIVIPVAQKTFEAFLPMHLSGFEALALIAKIAEETTDHLFIADDETTLCREEDGSILDLSLPLWRQGLKNGDKLLLI